MSSGASLKYGDFNNAAIIAGLPKWKTSMCGAAVAFSQASCQWSIWAARPSSPIVPQRASAAWVYDALNGATKHSICICIHEHGTK
jgi:hypothetical protein